MWIGLYTSYNTRAVVVHVCYVTCTNVGYVVIGTFLFFCDHKKTNWTALVYIYVCSCRVNTRWRLQNDVPIWYTYAMDYFGPIICISHVPLWCIIAHVWCTIPRADMIRHGTRHIIPLRSDYMYITCGVQWHTSTRAVTLYIQSYATTSLTQHLCWSAHMLLCEMTCRILGQ